MQKPQHVKIPATRYIELLEIEIKMLKTPPRTLATSGCTLHETTKRIRATGLTSKQWAKKNGFNDNAVRQVICGVRTIPDITAALIRDGFMEP